MPFRHTLHQFDRSITLMKDGRAFFIIEVPCILSLLILSILTSRWQGHSEGRANLGFFITIFSHVIQFQINY